MTLLGSQEAQEEGLTVLPQEVQEPQDRDLREETGEYQYGVVAEAGAVHSQE
jgi:hypothetical protein